MYAKHFSSRIRIVRLKFTSRARRFFINVFKIVTALFYVFVFDDQNRYMKNVSRILDSTRVEIKSLETSRLRNLEDALKELDSKTAAWIASAPMPAQLGEARIYALESRLRVRFLKMVHLFEVI